MTFNFGEFRQSVKELVQKGSGSITIEACNEIDHLSAYDVGYHMETKDIIADADKVFDLTLEEFGVLLDKIEM